MEHGELGACSRLDKPAAAAVAIGNGDHVIAGARRPQYRATLHITAQRTTAMMTAAAITTPIIMMTLRSSIEHAQQQRQLSVVTVSQIEVRGNAC